MEQPARDTSRIVLPPASYLHEQEKVETALAGRAKFIAERRLNEIFVPATGRSASSCRAGMYNAVMRALQLLGPGRCVRRHPHPALCPERHLSAGGGRGAPASARGKRAVLMVEEGPARISRAGAARHPARAAICRPRAWQGRAADGRRIHRRRCCATGWRSSSPPRCPRRCRRRATPPDSRRGRRGCSARSARPPAELLHRLPGAPDLHGDEAGASGNWARTTSARDIGCHLFSILPPFNIGNTTMGYGLGWAGAAALNAPDAKRRTISVMGDGGFWHNGLTRGVGNAVFNKSDNVLMVVDNGYSAATGGQDIPSSRRTTEAQHQEPDRDRGARRRREMGAHARRAPTTWRKMRDVLREALTTRRARAEGDRRAVGMHAEQAAPRSARCCANAIEERRARGASSASAWTRTPAPAIMPASASRAARR